MPSLRTTLLAAAASFTAVANADYTIDPNSVDLGTRESWCTYQKNACPFLCQQISSGLPTDNDCDPDTLTYSCVCDNGKKPNVSEYSESLPFFICQTWVKQCGDNCTSDPCKSDCVENHPCGAQNPIRVNTTTSSTPASTTNPNTIYTGAPGSGNGSKGAGAALEVGRTYGLAIVLTGLFAGFALL